MTEGNPTAEEARAKLALWTYPYTGIDPLGFAYDMDALIEAVRQEERERTKQLRSVAVEYRALTKRAATFDELCHATMNLQLAASLYEDGEV